MEFFRKRAGSIVSSTVERPPEKIIAPDDDVIKQKSQEKKVVFVSAGFTEIPKALLQTEVLQELDLSFNRLVSVSVELFALKNLKKLILRHNYIHVLPNDVAEKSGKKLAIVQLDGNPLAFPPLSVSEKGWSAVKKWMPENPSYVAFRLHYGEKDGMCSYVDFEYSGVRDRMVKTKDEDRDSSFAAVENETNAWRLPTITRHECADETGKITDRKKKGFGKLCFRSWFFFSSLLSRFWAAPNERDGKHLFPVKHMYFGVYDGHCGDWVAEALTQNLYKKFVEARVFDETAALDYNDTLKTVFMELDKVICEKLRGKNASDGSTCVTVSFTSKGQMICAHVGDSRAVARVQSKPKELTQDHDPDPNCNKAEKERVENRGGTVDYYKGSWRVNQNLSVSRAFGDTNLKKGDPMIVDAEPEVTVSDIDTQMDTLIVCSDGLHHLLKNEEIIKIASKKHLAEEAGLALLAEIDTNTRSQIKGHDNATILTLKMRHGVIPVEYMCKTSM